MSSAHSAEHYNCANATGCILVDDIDAQSDYNATEYPIVMAHGMAGWTRLFGLIDYWYGIPDTLIENGAEVYVTKTSSVHDSEYRGEQLLQQVKTITAVTGEEKVNLFGHSHGGHDIRYVAAVAPELVASVTAVASPEQGSKMADWVIKAVTKASADDGYVDGEFNPDTYAVIGFFNFIGEFMDRHSGINVADLQEQDSYRSATALSTNYMRDYFNPKYPAAMPSEYCGYPPEDYVVNGVAYYSFSGAGAFLNPYDPSDYLMALTALAMGDDPNDGLVSSCSSRLGYVIRDDYPMNHLDSINQIFGLVALEGTDPLAIYRQQVNRLKLAGF